MGWYGLSFFSYSILLLVCYTRVDKLDKFLFLTGNVPSAFFNSWSTWESCVLSCRKIPYSASYTASLVSLYSASRGGSFAVYPIRIHPLTFVLHRLCILLYKVLHTFDDIRY